MHATALARFEKLFEQYENPTHLETTATDPAQYRDFLANSGFFNAETLAGPLRLLAEFDLTTVGAIYAKSAYRVLDALYSRAIDTFESYNFARIIRPPTSFSEMHDLLLTLLDSVCRVYIHGVGAHFSDGIADFKHHGLSLRAAVSTAEESVSMLLVALEHYDKLLPEGNTLAHRLASILDVTRTFEPDDEIAPAELLSTAIEQHGTLEEVVNVATKSFMDIIAVSPEDLAQEAKAALLLSAIELASKDNVASIKRRIRIISEVIRRATEKAPRDMILAYRQAIPELVQTEALAVTIRERLQMYMTMTTSRAMRRMFLKDTYTSLAEDVWRRLTSPLLYAMFLLEDSPKSFAEVADWATFGNRVQWLEDRHNPTFALVLQGVSTVIRNAGSHGGIDVTGAKILFTSRNADTGKVKTEEWSDEEFERHVVDLLDTCIVLRTVNDVFLVENWEELGAALVSRTLPEVLVRETLRFYLGRWHLSLISIDVVDGAILMEVGPVASRDGVPPGQVVSLLPALAALVPAAVRAEVVIRDESAVSGCIRSALQPYLEFNQATDREKEVLVLSTWFAPEVEAEGEVARDVVTRYRGTIVHHLARIVSEVVDQFEGQVGTLVPRERSEFVSELRSRVALCRRVLRSASGPAGESRLDNALLDIFRDVEQGLRHVEDNSAAAGRRLTRARDHAWRLQRETLEDAAEMNAWLKTIA